MGKFTSTSPKAAKPPKIKNKESNRNFHAVNANLLLKKEKYYFISDIPKLFNDIDSNAADSLTDRILKAYFDNRLELLVYCGEEDDKIFPIPCGVLSKDPIAWELHKDDLMIHIKDLILVFKDNSLEEISESLSLMFPCKLQKKLKTKEIDQKIIERYEDLHKSNPEYSDSKIVEQLIDEAKKRQNSSKNKKQRIREKQVDNKLINSTPKHIADIISGYYSDLITADYNTLITDNDIFNDIQLGIDYLEASKNKDDSLPKVDKKPSEEKANFSCSYKERCYLDHKDFINKLYEGNNNEKPDINAVQKACTDLAIKKIAKNHNRKKNSVGRVINNLNNASFTAVPKAK